MLQSFQRYITKNCHLKPGSKVIVGLSGGTDSVVLTHLLHQAGFQVIAAHCNFQLRAAESDNEQAFVESFCSELGIELFVMRFETSAFAAYKNISIQMAARELRYDWFEKLRVSQHCTAIAVAHHADDQLETFFLNLIRGSGLQGLKGMKARNGYVVRPLLGFRRAEIEAYLQQHQLHAKDDSSNADTKYLRNKIRHQLIPAIAGLTDGAKEGMYTSIGLLHQDAVLHTELLERECSRLLNRLGEDWHIRRDSWMEADSANAMLYALIGPFGFKGAAINEILQSVKNTAGARFFSSSHRLSCERDGLLIQRLTDLCTRQPVYIEHAVLLIGHPLNLTFEVIDLQCIGSLHQPPEFALLDFSLLHFPLCLRPVSRGDRFQPFGMKGSRLVSDFLTDRKLSRAEKERVFVLENADGSIVWLVGFRIDGRFAVGPETIKVWKATLNR